MGWEVVWVRAARAVGPARVAEVTAGPARVAEARVAAMDREVEAVMAVVLQDRVATRAEAATAAEETESVAEALRAVAVGGMRAEVATAPEESAVVVMAKAAAAVAWRVAAAVVEMTVAAKRAAPGARAAEVEEVAVVRTVVAMANRRSTDRPEQPSRYCASERPQQVGAHRISSSHRIL